MTPLDRPVPRTLRSQPLFPLTVAWLALGLSAGCGSGGPGGRGGQVGDPCDASRPCRSDLVCGTNGMCVVDEPPPDQGVVVLPDLGPGVTITGIELTPVGETADLTIGATDTVQFSADMVSWQNSTATPTVLASDAEMDAVYVKYPFFLQDGRKAQYYRVEVSVP